jgi:hypothetical protein
VVTIEEAQQAVDNIQFYLDNLDICNEDTYLVEHCMMTIQVYLNQQNEKAAAQRFVDIMKDM